MVIRISEFVAPEAAREDTHERAPVQLWQLRQVLLRQLELLQAREKVLQRLPLKQRL